MVINEFNKRYKISKFNRSVSRVYFNECISRLESIYLKLPLNLKIIFFSNYITFEFLYY